MTKALKLPEVENRIRMSGNDVVVTSPEQFGALLRSEFDMWGKVVRDANIRGDQQ